MYIPVCTLLIREMYKLSTVQYQNSGIQPWVPCCWFCPIKTMSSFSSLNRVSRHRQSFSYIVKSGDSLYKIALEYGVTVDALKKANNLSGDIIYPWQHLIIPVLVLPDGVYSIGSRGTAVIRIQQAMSVIGYSIQVDGIYGSQTKELMASIQMKFPDLKADGIYGPKTKPYIQNLLDINYRIVQNPEDLVVLVNKLNALPYYYVPPDLTVPNVPFSFEEFLPQRQMRKVAAESLEQLFEKAQDNNINLVGVSGYRSYERQAEIFSNNYKKSSEEAVKFSARPGESEHQTGLTIDLSSASADYELVQSFSNTTEGQWLRENAPDYGFILRYQEGKEYITGYQYEPWHIRYVGLSAAQEMAQKKLTLEEYLG